MIVGLYQCASPAGDMEAGFATLEQAMAQANEAGVNMLVLPEIFLPGYDAMMRAPVQYDPQIDERLSALCVRFEIGLTIGLPEWVEDKVFNAAKAFSADGTVLACHRKLQPWGPVENATYAAGNKYTVFDYAGTRFGLLICYDVEFAEHVRALARIGAEVILVPTANMMPHTNVNQVIVPARAAENAVTVVYANYCGSEGALDYVGLSGIWGPDGYTLASKGHDPGLCIAELPKGWSEHGIPLMTQLADLRRIEDDG